MLISKQYDMTVNKLILVLSFHLSFLSIIIAQNISYAVEWQKCIGGAGIEAIYSIKNTSDGGFIFVGEQATDKELSGLETIKGQIWVVKLSSNYTVEWEKRVGDYMNFEVPCQIVESKEGGYMILSYAVSDSSDVICSPSNLNEILMTKLSSKGEVQWRKCFGGKSYELSYSLINSSDGGYVLLGVTDSNDGDVSGNHGGRDTWVVKVSSTGNIQWQKCLGGTSTETLLSIVQTTDGGYVLAGYTNSTDGDITNNHGSGDVWVVKLSSQGILQWQKCYGGSGGDFALSIIQTKDGGYIFAGETNSNDGDVKGNHSGYSDAWVCKLSTTGELQWQKCIGGFLDERINSIIQTYDGGYMIAGWTDSKDGDITDFRGGYNDGLIAKLSSKGDLQWIKSMGGSVDEKFRSILPLPNGGYLAAGFTSSKDIDVLGNSGREDAWIVKISSDAKTILGRVKQTNTICQSLPNPQYIANLT
jgi:hypothetical protein